MNSSALFLAACCLLAALAGVSEATNCLAGDHQAFSLKHTGAFHECKAYASDSCGTASTVNQLFEDKEYTHNTNFLNFDWSPCGPISQACEDMWIKEACFFQCEPSLIAWQDPAIPTNPLNAPLCANDCDDLYDACANDLFCVRDWTTDWKPQGGKMVCQQECRTFRQIYNNGEDFCNSFAGSAYKYSDDKDVCLRFNFDEGEKNTNGLNGNTGASSSLVASVAVTLLSAVAAIATIA